MLTQAERKNIINFARLRPQHQYILRYRLKKKCLKTLLDLEFLLLRCFEIGLKQEDVLKYDNLTRLIAAYELAVITESVKNSEKR